jgi:hypothetical protein
MSKPSTSARNDWSFPQASARKLDRRSGVNSTAESNRTFICCHLIVHILSHKFFSVSFPDATAGHRPITLTVRGEMSALWRYHNIEAHSFISTT